MVERSDALIAEPMHDVRLRADQPALRQEEQHDRHQRGGRRGPRRADLRPRGLLGDHHEQAAQLPPAHRHAAQDQRPRRGRGARQRAVRGRRRRDGPPQAAADMRRPHPAAPAHRHLLRAGREGQRALLRPQARKTATVDTKGSGSTTCAPTSTSRSRTRPLKRADLDDFVACYHPRQPPRAQGDRSASSPSPTRRWSPATRSASTSSGSRTTASTTSTTCRHRRCSRRKSLRIWRRPWLHFGMLCPDYNALELAFSP